MRQSETQGRGGYNGGVIEESEGGSGSLAPRGEGGQEMGKRQSERRGRGRL
jgi:hypothetical protein